MSAADDRCSLFTPDTSAALQAGLAQARGAALRAGASRESLQAAETNAWAAVRRVDCASPDIQTAAQRVRTAFAGFAKLSRLTYPGDLAGWRADRVMSQQARWRLMQDAAFGPDRMTFGLAGRDAPGVLLAVARFADGAQPYTARLLMRDTDRSYGPYLDRRGTAGQLPLARRLPPRAGLKAYTAEARSVAGQDLLPKDAKAGWAFRFPAAAVRDLARLDPREAIMVEFLFQDEVVRSAYVEVGDFAAGQAFVQVAQR
ncbi:MAG: hypothetical protein ABI655_07230 [Phenylobacterium sp.]